jgi:hypothetical protein
MDISMVVGNWTFGWTNILPALDDNDDDDDDGRKTGMCWMILCMDSSNFRIFLVDF